MSLLRTTGPARFAQAVLLVVAAGCGEATPVVETPVATTVVVTGAAASVVEWESLPLAAVVKDQRGEPIAGASVTWSTSDAAKATVSASGVVAGLVPGAVTITAASGNASGTFGVTITPGTVAAVTVSATASTIVVGAAATLTATPKDAAGRALAGRSITWSSANASIATTTQAGVVTGVLPGTASISATTDGVTGASAITVTAPTLAQESNGMSGSLGAYGPELSGDTGFDHGFSFYTSIHSLQAAALEGTQLGWGTWLKPFTQFTGSACPDPSAALPSAYQTIEGGAGMWVSARFPSPMSKFRINSTPDCYRTEIGSTAWSFYGTLLPSNKLGLAQLSNRLLVVPDGVVFEASASQTFLGYGWLALPLIPAGASAAGVPTTGDQSWTLFFRATNFAGPVAFFTPDAFSSVHAADGSASRGLDVKTSLVHSASIEFGTTKSITATVAGTRYLRIPRITFPVDGSGKAIMLADLRKYGKTAVWDAFAAWMAGGSAPTAIASAGVRAPKFTSTLTTVRIGGVVSTDTALFGPDVTLNTAGSAVGLKWGPGLEKGVLPEYYKEVAGKWVPVPVSDVPRESWLTDQVFAPAKTSTSPAVDQGATSPWTSAKWKAGPFTATLSDGSTVEYVWYRFIEQPAIARLGLGAAQLAALQSFAETMHQAFGTFGISIAAPTAGALTTLDPAQIVTPPTGMERGYVPIVIRQR